MDFCDATIVVLNRIKKIEPENAQKIVRYLLLSNNGDEEMIRMAFGPDNFINSFIHRAKMELTHSLPPRISSRPVQFQPLQPVTTFHPPPYWEPSSSFEHQNVPSLDYNTQFLIPQDQLRIPNDYSGAPGASRAGRRSLSFTGFPAKNCMYFDRGFCKNGSSCRFFHGNQSFMNPMFTSSNPDDDSDSIFSASSLEQLEIEIIDLLKSRRGAPVSIASLPMIYFDRFGKILQAEGYLTESQRHGRSGYSLTRLLARLKNSIRVIDRPHGQHSVVLAEDASKYMENRNQRSDPGPIISGSRQIYLTFPAESTFSEDDVAEYFNTFGAVEDVRIPSQLKRMFGFVTFASSDTVKAILSQGNPHFVCGARVLVKPYREKSKFRDSKFEDIESEQYFSQRYEDMDGDLNSIPPRNYEPPRLMRKQEHEHALEVERRRLMELKFGKSMATLSESFSEDHSMIPSVQRINHFLDVMNDGASSSNNPDHERDGHDLPETSSSSGGGRVID